jgi:hypothetical protein
MLMNRSFIASFATLVLALGWPGTRASAAGTFACNKAGGSQATIDACGARWSAANLRVHIAAKQYGGSDVVCLTRTATTLDALATKWLASGTSGPYTLPCGNLPAAASSDDGLLGSACPTSVWSYGNRGKPNCDTTIVSLRARSGNTTGKTLGRSSGGDGGPSYEETAQWLADNMPSLANATLTNGIQVRTTAFSVTDCIVSWQFRGTASDGSSLADSAYSIPFGKVTGVRAMVGTETAFQLDIDGTIHQTLPAISDLSKLGFPMSQDASQHVARALQRLARLCRSKKDPF